MRRPLPSLWLAAVTALSLAVGCDCGRTYAPSSCKTLPSTSAEWHLVNGGSVGPAEAPATCQRSVKPSSLTGAQVLALGVHQVGEVVTFDVPKDTGSITIVSQASSGVVDTITVATSHGSLAWDNTVIPTSLTTPANKVLYDDLAAQPVDGTNTDLWTGGKYSPPDTPLSAAITLPNTTQGLTTSAEGYPAGQWRFTVNDFAYECAGITGCSGGSNAGKYDITVILKALVPTTGTVDLSFYFVTQALTATEAMTNTHVQRFLDTLALIYSRAGLCLGTITFYDVPAWARNRYATGVDATKLGSCDELDQMFTLSQPGNALNFFLVDSIGQGAADAGTPGKVVGIDGTIPGPSSVGGTIHSGAVVNFADYASGTCTTASPNWKACGADSTAYIAAHEGGHWMGLFHTTEYVGVMNDPLTDTPVCQCTTACGVSDTALKCCLDPNSSTQFTGDCPSGNFTPLTGSNCNSTSSTCGGASSLMFWALGTGSDAQISGQQGGVMRANPVVH